MAKNGGFRPGQALEPASDGSDDSDSDSDSESDDTHPDDPIPESAADAASASMVPHTLGGKLLAIAERAGVLVSKGATTSAALMLMKLVDTALTYMYTGRASVGRPSARDLEQRVAALWQAGLRGQGGPRGFFDPL